jgi:hypothetical protein
MQFGGGSKLGVSGVLMLCTMAAFAIIVALVLVPKIAEAIGVKDQHVDYVVAGVAFLIAVVATRWAKSLNKKSPEKK